MAFRARLYLPNGEHIGQLSVREIARVRGISESRVKTQLRLAA